MIKGNVFDIQRFAVSDGPGVRTTVFLKGCNLRCVWCHNPESQSFKQEIRVQEQNCIYCRKCIDACYSQAMYLDNNGKRIIDRKRCNVCGSCIENCYTEALSVMGREMSIDAVIHEVEKDSAMYKISGGGMTVSGGEPLLQLEFTEKLLKSAKELGIHTAVETAGCVPYKYLERIEIYTDLFLYDIKGYDTQNHKKNTGKGNEQILENLSRLSEKNRIFVRMPIIAEKNDFKEELQGTAAFLRNLVGVEQIEILPYHRFGESKYAALGRNVEHLEAPDEEKLKFILQLMEYTGKKVILRGNK